MSQPGLHLVDAIEEIDAHLGQGYAKAHPALIGAYMITAALSDFWDNDRLIDALRSDHPLMGETLDGIADGLRAIAEKIEEK